MNRVFAPGIHISLLLFVLIFAFSEQMAPGQTAPKIVFGSVRDGDNHDIFSMALDGSNEVRLTTNAAYDDQPKW